MRVRILPFLVALALLAPSRRGGAGLRPSVRPSRSTRSSRSPAPRHSSAAPSRSRLQILEALTNKSGGIKGRPIKFVIVDDQSNPAVSVQLTNGLIAKKVPVILGPIVHRDVSCRRPAAGEDRPGRLLLLAVDLAGARQLSVFVDGLDAQRRARARALLSRQRLDEDRADDDDRRQRPAIRSSTSMKRWHLPENSSLKLVAREHWAGTDLNITAQAERIKNSGAQAMIGWSAGTATGTLLHGLHDTGVDIPVACGNGNMIPEQLARYATFLPKNLLFPGRRSLVLDPTAPKAMHAVQVAYFDAFKAAGVGTNLAHHARLGSGDARHRCVQETRHRCDGRADQRIHPAHQGLGRHQRRPTTTPTAASAASASTAWSSTAGIRRKAISSRSANPAAASRSGEDPEGKSR